MKLFGSYTSPFVRHCRIALIEASMAYEFIDTDLAASAAGSPTQRVPFFEDGEVRLTDSSSILKYLREKSGKAFLPDISDFELYCMTNTLQDTAVNLFMLERHGMDISGNDYLKRQSSRVETGLAELDSRVSAETAPSSDGKLRLACFLDWGLYRERIALEAYPNLRAFLDRANEYSVFVDTAPPR